ncbi:MAG: hypothetical protein ACR5LF_06435 [Symbiopectobacterium sp.]
MGLTTIHVTHDREEAMVMADRIVILHKVRVMEAGSQQQVYHHPASAFVAAFMGAENQLMLEAYYDGDRLTLRGDEQGAAFVPRHAGASGHRVGTKLSGWSLAAQGCQWCMANAGACLCALWRRSARIGADPG